MPIVKSTQVLAPLVFPCLLAFIQPAAHAIPALIQCLKDPVEQVRSAAAAALEYIGVEVKVVVSALIECFTIDDWQVRYGKQSAHKQMQPESPHS
jgi:HEAT repeat protein